MVPELGIQVVSESHGPARPWRDSNSLTPATAMSSVARHFSWTTVPTTTLCPPLGAWTRAAGRVVSANVAVTTLSASMVRASGLALPLASPDHPTNESVAPGVAVNATTLPSGYWARLGFFVTLPVPTTFTVRLRTVCAKLAAMVWLAVTLLNVYVVTAPTETPSTSTSATW